MWVGTIKLIPEAVFATEGLAANWQRVRTLTAPEGVLVLIHDVPMLTYDAPIVGHLDAPTLQQMAEEYAVLHGLVELVDFDAAKCILVGTEAKGKLKWYFNQLVNEFDQKNKPLAFRTSQDRLVVVKRTSDGTPDITILDIIPSDTQ
jgi:hypothetical protein